MAQTAGLAQGLLAAQEHWAANRRVHRTKQPIDPHPGVAAGAVAQRYVSVCHLGPTVGAVNADFDVWLLAAETLESGHQPHGAERGADADAQHLTLRENKQ